MSLEKVYEGFSNPPRSCSQIPFWFLNGNVDGHEYSRQIEEMASQGVVQAMPHPRYGMDRRDYLSEKFWSAMGQLMRKASDTDFTIHLYDEFNWSSGPAGGRVTADPQHRGLGISMRARSVSGPARVIFDDCDDRQLLSGMLTNFSERENYLRILLVPLADDDTLDFSKAEEVPAPSPSEDVGIDIPAGRFEAIVFFTVRTNHPSPIATGCGGLIDYLAPEPTRMFIEVTHDEYAKRFQDYFGTTIQSIFYDEAGPFSAGSFTWTKRFPEEFKRLKGYDIVENVYHLFYDSDDTTEKVRCDYWDVVAELFTENFIGQIADWCAEHGIALTGHSFEEINRWTWSADPYRLLRRQQWPGTDSLGGYKNYSEIKLAQGVADISGKRILVCESIGVMDLWAATLRKTKRAYNQLAVAGVTHTIPHAFFQSIESAKCEAPPSFFFQNYYWKYYHLLADMTARHNWVNRQGVHVADIAVFYPLVSWWGDGRGGRGYALPQGHASGVYDPKGVGTPEDPKIFNSIIDTMMRNQLDHDVIDSQGLEEASIRDGKIEIAGEQFSVLVVPPMNTIRTSDLLRFRELLDAGVHLVAVDRWPSISMEKGRNDKTLLSTVEDLRSRARSVQDAASLVTLLRDLIEPDITVTAGDSDSIDACHRRITDETGHTTDLYLICNIQYVEKSVDLRLRATGEVAIWNCETGEAYRGVGNRDGSGTSLSLRLGPLEALYVAIGENVDDGLPALPIETTDAPSSTIEVDGSWLFKPLPGETPNLRSYGHVTVTVPVHVFRTTQIYDEDPVLFDPVVWQEYFLPEFDDSSWDLAHCLRKPMLYNEWYGSRVFRTVIPLGADAIKLPIPINCEYALYVDGTRVRVATENTELESGWLEIPYREGKAGILAIECRSMADQYGITGPFEFRCHPQEVPLGSWVEHGLWWYSGYGQYDKELELSALDGQKVILDLGEVKESVEVWVNGRLAGERIWPPYSFDITPYVVEGGNNIRVIASNLLANRMFWAEVGRRDQPPKTLPSGLLGPVQVDFYDVGHAT